MDNSYYIIATEWLYPTESGRDVDDDTADSQSEALERCKRLCEDELRNFSENCGDCLQPELTVANDGTQIGYLITPKNGLDEWVFLARVIKVEPIAYK